MGRWTTLNSGTGSPGTSYSFGPGFNVSGTSVQFALDDPSNMLFDPGFEDSPALAQWSQGTPGAFTRESTVTFQGGYAVQATANGANLYQSIHCDPSDQFIATCYTRNSATVTGNAQLVIAFLDSSHSVIGPTYYSAGATPSTTWNQIQVSAKAPSNACFVNFYVVAGGSGTWYFDNCSLRRVSLGNNIAVGVIDNSHIVPGANLIVITNGLPTLPSTSYPAGICIFNTLDGYIYKNVSNTWKNIQDPADMIAGQLAANVVYAGTVSASQVNAGLFNGCSLICTLNGITTTINNQYGNSGKYCGVIVNQSNAQTELNPQAVCGFYYGTQQWSLGTDVGIGGGGQLFLTSPGGVWVGGNQIIAGRQTGPGLPSFTTLAQALTWCQNLYYALNSTAGHGLIN